MKNEVYQKLVDLSLSEGVSQDSFVSESMKLMGYAFVDCGVYIKDWWVGTLEDASGFMLSWPQNDLTSINIGIWEGICENEYLHTIKITDAPPLLRMLDAFFGTVNEERFDV